MIKRNIIKWQLIKQPFKISPTKNHQYYHSILHSDNHQHETLITLLQSCQHSSQTCQLHSFMIKTGLDQISFPLSKLLAKISMQDTRYASSIFKEIERPNLYMFNVMLRGYSVSDDPKEGLDFFDYMMAEKEKRHLLFDQFTFVSVLKCCCRVVEMCGGISVHCVVVKSGFDLYLNVTNAILHFYCVWRRITDAHQVFDEMDERRDLVSWNTLMGGYVSVGRYEFVVDLFQELYRDGFGVSVTTVLNVLSALEELRNVSLGKCLHVFCIKFGFLSNLNVVTALISMYGKNGYVHFARRIFDEIEVKKDVVLWNCLIDSYAKNNLLEEALELLRLMNHHSMKPNSSTLAGLLSACSASGALSLGQYVHCYVDEHRLPLDVVLGTAIVDMYAKSGSLEKAIEVFEKMESKDIRSWTAMISAYGAHGQANRAIELFARMEKEGFKPNEVTFLAVLNSCSHGGLVAEGLNYLRKMIGVYKLKPKIEHYGCIIDLLGRAGMLDEAYEVIKGLPVERDSTAWRALLGACRVYGNFDLAERVKRELEGINEKHPADLLALNSAYVVAGMLPCVVERGMKEMDRDEFGKKEAGWSVVEL